MAGALEDVSLSPVGNAFLLWLAERIDWDWCELYSSFKYDDSTPVGFKVRKHEPTINPDHKCYYIIDGEIPVTKEQQTKTLELFEELKMLKVLNWARLDEIDWEEIRIKKAAYDWIKPEKLKEKDAIARPNFRLSIPEETFKLILELREFTKL